MLWRKHVRSVNEDFSAVLTPLACLLHYESHRIPASRPIQSRRTITGHGIGSSQESNRILERLISVEFQKQVIRTYVDYLPMFA